MHGNKPLDLKKTREARSEETGYVKDIGVYRYFSRAEAIAISGGKPPVKVRCVDTDKGERYRSRLVAMEFRKKTEASWFAGTPPLESLRVLCRWLATRSSGRRSNKSMVVLDVKRAHFHAKATRRLFIELPPERRVSVVS